MDRLQLFSLQSYDLTKFGGPIRPELGTYRDHPRIIAAQRELYMRLGTEQVIWLSQTPPHISSKLIGHFVHLVEADSRDIRTIIDGLIWNHIIHDDPHYIPPEEHLGLRENAMSSNEDYGAALRKLEDGHLARRLPHIPWDGVSKNAIEFPSDDVLLVFPFTHSIVTKVTQIEAKHIEKSMRAILA